MRAGWSRLTGDDRVKRRLISAFLLLLLAVMVPGALPADFFLVTALHVKSFVTAFNAGLAPYAATAGLQVGWSMFAPNPTRQNTYLDAEITYPGGRKHIWTFPQMQELGYAERYAKERYRKFANERLWVKENSALWPDAARYIARLNADSSNLPQTVKLVHYWSVIPSEPSPGELLPPERWQREMFFVYTVRPGDLR
jgi:hypothetical protein